MNQASVTERVLRLMAEKKASDAYFSAHAPILLKINGVCVPLNSQALSLDGPLQALQELVTEAQLASLHATGELNIGLSIEGVGNFRLSAMRQRGSIALVIRYITPTIPTLDTLGMPAVLSQLVMQKRGLILAVGATGAGKSTTLAAMLDHRNTHTAGHILTIEDPVEYYFENKRCIVNQREVGSDTASFQIGLQNALRQAPDVIFIGEIRDRETMSAAIAYAQSGHLCLATLHANNSYQALNRILNFYPVEVRPILLSDLATALKAVISQRLLRSKTGQRVPAVEIMLNTPLISEAIARGDFGELKESMEKALSEGAQTFEQDIARLVLEGVVERQEGLLHADSATNLLWRLDNAAQAAKAPLSRDEDDDDQASFTEINLDIRR